MDQVDERTLHAMEIHSALDTAISEGRFEEAALLKKEVRPSPPPSLPTSGTRLIAQRCDCKSTHHHHIRNSLFPWCLVHMARLIVLMYSYCNLRALCVRSTQPCRVGYRGTSGAETATCPVLLTVFAPLTVKAAVRGTVVNVGSAITG